MTMPYENLTSKPVLLMTPTERGFDWCFNQAAYSRVWMWMIWPVRTALCKHPLRMIRAVAAISPWIMFPYTIAAFIGATALRVGLMLVGVVILLAGLAYRLPALAVARVRRWYTNL